MCVAALMWKRLRQCAYCGSECGHRAGCLEITAKGVNGMRIIIRADGNVEIAMGHMMRCLSIADALRALGADVVFVTAGDESRGLLQARGYEDVVLGTSYCDMESELGAFLAYFRQQPARLILIDSYFVTRKYMEVLRTWARTALLDDLGEPAYPVDILINYNIYAQKLPYREVFQKSGIPLPEQFLLGCAYAPLREQFGQGRRSACREMVQDVLITTGGGDAENAAGALCGRIAEEIKEGRHRGIRYHVICGPFSGHREKLRLLAAGHSAFLIHENVTCMWELMEQCDIAVSATGSTMYELCSMRLPAVCFYFAENQRRMAEYFDRFTEIKSAGNIAENRERVLEGLLTRLTRLEEDGQLRRRIREQMETLTDGLGARRIAESLILAGMEVENANA